MSSKGNFFDKFVFQVELPTESIPGMPLVEIYGCQRVLVENHNGVTMYGNNEIRVKVSYGQLHICGSGLELARMSKQQLVITGQIEGISLCRGGRR